MNPEEIRDATPSELIAALLDSARAARYWAKAGTNEHCRNKSADYRAVAEMIAAEIVGRCVR